MTDPKDEQQTRALKAMILCMIVVFVYTQMYLKPARPVPAAAPNAGQAVAGAPVSPSAPTAGIQATGVIPASPGGVAVVAPPAPATTLPSLDQLKSAGVVGVDTGVARLSISKLGGRLIGYLLTEYKLKVSDSALLDMVEAINGMPAPLGVAVGNQSDAQTQYNLVSVNGASPDPSVTQFALAEGAKLELSFAGSLADGTAITKTLTFRRNSYLVDVAVGLNAPRADGQPVWLEWSHFFPKDAENPRLQLQHLTYLDDADKLKHVTLPEIAEGFRDVGTAKWMSIGDLYFMATLIPKESEGRKVALGRSGDLYLGRVSGTATGGQFTVYVGPKDYKTLNSYGSNLERTIDLGWFTFLAYPLLWTLYFLNQVLGNYGLAIIALTLVVKTLLLPLSKASFVSMKRMQDLQPEIAALRERIKDPTQLNQEVFALYKRKGVNPMGGCFPILVQIPVFLGLYQALLNSIELRHAPFALWITDLSSPERLVLLGIPVPVMVLLMAASMLFQSWTGPQPADEAQRKAMMIMPFVFAAMFIIFPMPSGLVLYWLVNNLISITQQIYLRKEGSGSAYKATFLASLLIFFAGYVLTLV